MHEARYDNLTSQAEHTLKLLLGIQSGKDEDDMDPAERQRYSLLNSAIIYKLLVSYTCNVYWTRYAEKY